VNLREESISGPPHNPGSGGWPTIRYFNKETGPEGGSYTQKTDGPICQELGNVDNMRAYVEEYGGPSCSALTGEGCSEKETTYIEKWKVADGEERVKALDRLRQMSGLSMKADLADWVERRKRILQQLIDADKGVKDEL
jgi:hypothetical protein